MIGRGRGWVRTLCQAPALHRAGVIAAGMLMILGPFQVSPAGAQEGSRGVSGSVVLETYRFSSAESLGVRSVHLLSLPFAAGIDLRPEFRLEMTGAYASARIERADGTSASIDGLTDTQVQLQTTLGADRVRIAAILQLPTGHSGYTVEEAEAAGVIAADVLPFQVTNWGSGGAFGVHSSVAQRIRGFGLGASASYLIGREFEVFAGDDTPFRPGNQLAVGLAADHMVGQAGKAALHVQVVRHGDDELAGSNLYRSGSRYQATGSYAFAAPRYSSAVVFAGFVHRTQGRFFQPSEEIASQNLIRTGAVVRMPFSWGTLVPSADLHVLRSEDGRGQGYVGSLGTSAEREIHGMTIIPTLRTRLGRVVASEGERSGLWGVELGLTARFGGREQ